MRISDWSSDVCSSDLLIALLLQAAAFAFQRALDALVDRAFPGTQALVLGLVLLVVAERALQLGAQLLHLGHQRGDGIARRVACDAQGLDRKSTRLNSSH